MSNPFVTTGVTGTYSYRQELSRFVQEIYGFSLYVQALQIMQITVPESKVTEQDPDSHFQIGGIHGVPYLPWTGDGTSDHLLTGVEYGYCTHGNNLFPTWHRPYMALYEQTVQKHAMEIAKKYTSDKVRWTNAAKFLRLPYWDWANPETAIPPSQFIADRTVSIITPNGRRNVDNPLLKYTFKTPLEYTRHGQHYRYTETNREAAGINTFKTRFNNKERQQLREKVLHLFNPKLVSTWDTFSNHGPDDDYVADSLEGIHDHVHDLVGGFMGDPSRAGFDPIFYFHHCNVDRLLAIWQSLQPNIWVSPGNSRDGTNTIPALAPVGAKTDLTPFWKSKSAFYDSDAVRKYTDLGYEYWDLNLKGIDTNDPEAVKKAIRKEVSELYGNFDVNIRKYLPQDNQRVVEAIRSKSSTHADAESAIDRLLLAFTAHVELEPEETQIFHPHSLEYFEWTARVRVKHYALGQSFGVHLYLDAPTGAASDDELYDSFVGSFYTFVNSKADSCENCRGQAGAVDEGYVYLNSTIAERSKVNSFRPENLLPYLTSKLSWKVKKLDGEEVPLDQVPSLEVVLHHTPVTLEAGGSLPNRGNVNRYPIVNRGF